MNKSTKLLLASISPVALAAGWLLLGVAMLDVARPSPAVEVVALATASPAAMPTLDQLATADLSCVRESCHGSLFLAASAALPLRSTTLASTLTSGATRPIPVRFREPDKPVGPTSF